MTARQRGVAELMIPIALALLSLGASAYVGYSHNDKTIEHRLSVVETQQDNDKERLRDVQDKVNRIYDKIAGW